MGHGWNLAREHEHEGSHIVEHFSEERRKLY